MEWSKAALIQAAGHANIANQMHGTLAALNPMWTAAGYLAAEQLGPNPGPVDLEHMSEWRIYVGEHGERLLDAVRSVPSAEIAVEPATLDQHAQQVTAVVREWYRWVGFEFTKLPGGGPLVGTQQGGFLTASYVAESA